MKKETRSFCLAPQDVELIQTEAERLGLSMSAALTTILRDWQQMKEGNR